MERSNNVLLGIGGVFIFYLALQILRIGNEPKHRWRHPAAFIISLYYLGLTFLMLWGDMAFVATVIWENAEFVSPFVMYVALAVDTIGFISTGLISLSWYINMKERLIFTGNGESGIDSSSGLDAMFAYWHLYLVLIFFFFATILLLSVLFAFFKNTLKVQCLWILISLILISPVIYLAGRRILFKFRKKYHCNQNGSVVFTEIKTPEVCQ